MKDQESKTTRSTAPQDRLIRELESIKRLLAVLLIKAGTSQSEIASALNVDQASVSRMLPSRQFKPFNTSEKG